MRLPFWLYPYEFVDIGVPLVLSALSLSYPKSTNRDKFLDPSINGVRRHSHTVGQNLSGRETFQFLVGIDPKKCIESYSPI